MTTLRCVSFWCYGDASWQNPVYKEHVTSISLANAVRLCHMNMTPASTTSASLSSGLCACCVTSSVIVSEKSCLFWQELEKFAFVSYEWRKYGEQTIQEMCSNVSTFYYCWRWRLEAECAICLGEENAHSAIDGSFLCERAPLLLVSLHLWWANDIGVKFDMPQTPGFRKDPSL